MWDALTTNWKLLLPLLTGALGLLALLPQPRRLPTAVGAGLLVLTFILAGFGIGSVTSIEQGLFYGFSFLAIVSGMSLIAQTQPARAALSFTLVVLSTAGLFLLLAAPFLFAATIIVYAGAIIVTFLFVLMLAQQTGQDDADLRSREPLFSTITGLLLLGTLFYLIQMNSGVVVQQQSTKADELQWLSDVAGRASRAKSPELMETLLKEVKLRDPDADLPVRMSAVLTDLYKERPKFVRFNQLATDVQNLMNDWQPLENKPQEMKGRRDILVRLHKIGTEATAILPISEVQHLSQMSGPVGVPPSELRRDATGQPAMPAENAAYLGKSLFTDYLLPVELGGLLLLVAVVGAIVISQRQDEQGKETP